MIMNESSEELGKIFGKEKMSNKRAREVERGAKGCEKDGKS